VSEDEQKTKTDHEPPPGASTTGTWNGIDYTATAKWLVLRKKEKPTADIFSISYVASAAESDRPVTFVFNGGPGASSAYLHVGAVGPQRVEFPGDGTMPAMPPRLVPNDESWLAFTDLVFVDPVGTGFSRVIDPDESKDDPKKEKGDEPHQYFGTVRDLEAMCEFVGRWLSDSGRWGSAVFIAGESYGGYRVGRLTRMLQEQAGIGLNGAILISPALEPALLATVFGWGDYEMVPWIDLLPTMAAAAAHHGRSRVFEHDTPIDDVLREAEAFATGEYATLLARGASMPADERERVLARFADLTGLDPELVARTDGRVRTGQFTRELLRGERRVVGAYDTTITATDPFPDRDVFGGADPTLTAVSSVFATAVNRQLRSEIGVETDREYKLIDFEVTMAWKNDDAQHYVQPTQGATDDFRAGLSMNPNMTALIVHGRYDLMTPYYTTERLRNLMRLDESVAERLTVRHFGGGHMFYTWEESRRAFTATVAEFMADAISR
jgi:carboxypeptidase C (cathepsin A)